MSVCLSTFLKNIKKIQASNPIYQTGGTGQDGTCDCIGLIMGAMYMAGHKRYDMHSTNYFSRYQMQTLDNINNGYEIGSIVYKRREDNGTLNDRYKPGGRYFTGDLCDYYHAGVVTSVNPLIITHCTSTANTSGIIEDTKIGNWSVAGRLKDIDYTNFVEEEEKEEETMTTKTAIVTSTDGNPVKLRADPSTKNRYIAKIPIGTKVEVIESAQGWAHIKVNGKIGYMMEEFLIYEDSGDSGSVPPTCNSNFEEEVLKKLDEILTLLNANG